MEMFGLSVFEIFMAAVVLISAVSTLIGFVWWASGMYYQLKRGADNAEEIRQELQATRQEFHGRTEKLFSLYGDHNNRLHSHEIDIVRLKDRIGIPADAGTRSGSRDSQ